MVLGEMIWAIFSAPAEAPDALIPAFCTEFRRGPYGTGFESLKITKTTEKIEIKKAPQKDRQVMNT